MTVEKARNCKAHRASSEPRPGFLSVANGSYPTFLFAFPARGFAVAMLTTLPIAFATSGLAAVEYRTRIASVAWPEIAIATTPSTPAFLVRSWNVRRIARGAIAELVASLLGLLQRMREINTELAARVASHTRRRPPSEALRRLQMELPLAFGAASNDVKTADSATSPTPLELEGPPEPPGLAKQPPRR